MAKFTTPLRIELVDEKHAEGRGLWRVAAPLRYESDLAGREFVIPEGFLTDYASVPRLPMIYWLFGDRVHQAPTLHDYLYQTGLVKRKLADDIFLEAMGVSGGLSKWQMVAMWLGVRAGGGFHYHPQS